MSSNTSPNGAVTSAETSDLTDKVTHVALGAPVAVVDAVNQAIDRWSDSTQRDKDLQVVRDQIEKGLSVAEEKGVTVRQQLSGRIEPAVSRVQPTVDNAVARVQPTVDRIQPTVQKLQTEARTRGSKVSTTTQEQFRKAQERVRGAA